MTRVSRRPEPLPIEMVKSGVLGRMEARWLRKGVDRARQQLGNAVGDTERSDDIWGVSMVGSIYSTEIYIKVKVGKME